MTQQQRTIQKIKAERRARTQWTLAVARFKFETAETITNLAKSAKKQAGLRV